MKDHGQNAARESETSAINVPVTAPFSQADIEKVRETQGRPRVLVAIASFGDKNLGFLKKVITEYRNMAMNVDIVIHSDAPKKLDGVKVLSGLPSRNRYSLPFAHKRTFAENVDRYDLFIYTEDDLEVTEQNIRMFLEVVSDLESDEIPGYLRYEVGEGGKISLPDVHGRFHWKPESVRRRGRGVVAEFTNEHAGFYILTQAQLRRAIASGGFLREPYEGRYGMLETGATDVYTCCGFRKIICVSALDRFLIHHMPNRYAGVLGVSLDSFEKQIQTLLAIGNNTHPQSTLCNTESKFLHSAWSKSYYEHPSAELLEMVPAHAESILSVGCGFGELEVKFQQRGGKVTALPLDSVIGAVAARRGIEVIYGTLDDGLKILATRTFDCVLISNLLHLLADPWRALSKCIQLVSKGGVLVVTGPNFGALPILVRRALRRGDYRKLKTFTQTGIHPHRRGTVKRQIECAGLRVSAVRWTNRTPPYNSIIAHHLMRGLIATDWIIQARRETS